MKVVTAGQMRELDARTIAEAVTGELLMERAGAGVARSVMWLARTAALDNPRVLLFAGRGNNGGDVYVAARYLQEQGVDSTVWIVGDPAAAAGDALHHFEAMQRAGVPWQTWTPSAAPPAPAVQPAVIVDGILGTGIRGAPREPAAGAIRHINVLGDAWPVVAVDIPSGLDADSGEAAGDAVRADVTVTMALPKRGFVEPAALPYVGSVEVVDIGVPAAFVEAIEAENGMLSAAEVAASLPARPRASHKGTFGHVLIVGGARGFSGAAALAARAACRSGVGLVSALVPEAVASATASIAPEAMVHPARQSDGGGLAADALERWGRDLDDFDAVLVGPGMTACDETKQVAARILAQAAGAVVADADALNVFAGEPGALRRRNGRPLVITPHPGEMARLLGTDTAAVQRDRKATARRAVTETGAVVVLKGAGTVVAGPDGTAAVNLTGNPGMAAGGMGDVLGGLLGGLAAQGMAAGDAARAAVYIHGRAGDTAARAGSPATLTAGDVIAALPLVFRELSPR
jgi:NAD(P)H-hydrate epimerase